MQVPFLDLKAQYRTLRREMRPAINSVLESCGFVVAGNEPNVFEKKFAEMCRVGHAIACCNGTAALLLAMQAMGIRRGDEVILPANTFIATAEAVSYLGATPVFVDCDEETALMTAASLPSATTKNTRLIVPVHLFGQTCDMDPILKFARHRSIRVLEDASQAHFATCRKRPAGSMGDAAGFSFYPGKNLGAYGEAGAVTTHDSKLAEKIRKVRNHGSAVKYQHELIGFNFRMDSIQSAVLEVKLKYIHRWNSRRRALAALYRDRLTGIGDIRFIRELQGHEAVYHLMVIRSKKRDALAAYLNAKGVGTGIHYPVPLHLQPAYRHMDRKRGAFPASERLAQEMLSLPMFAEMTVAQLEYVCKTVKKFYHESGRTARRA